MEKIFRRVEVIFVGSGIGDSLTPKEQMTNLTREKLIILNK